MIQTDKTYYTKMLSKERLIPFFRGDTLVCCISFFITNNPDKYIQRDNPWSVEEDNETGEVCYVDQLITTKLADNPKYSYETWHRFKIYIRNSFPTVKMICWRRYKDGITKTYKKEI